MPMNENIKSSLPSLESLGADIRDKHREAHAMARGMVSKAREIGQDLIRAKEQVPHGDWKQFVDAPRADAYALINNLRNL